MKWAMVARAVLVFGCVCGVVAVARWFGWLAAAVFVLLWVMREVWRATRREQWASSEAGS